MSDDLTARELLRRGEIPAREPLCAQLVALIEARLYWRPCGCSPRLFKHHGMDDPFAAPEGFKRPEPRPVYAAGRFVRLDKAAKAEKRQKAASQGVPAWVQQLRDRASSQDGSPTPVKQATPKQVHTPAFGGKLDAPVDRTPPKVGQPQGAARATQRPRAQPLGPPRDGVDRTPPRVEHDAAPSPRSAPGRPRAAVPPGFDRTPPRVAGPEATVEVRRGKPVVGATDGIDRRPPMVTEEAAAPAPSGLRGVRRPPAPAGLDRTPPRILPPGNEPAPTHPPANTRGRRPVVADGMDRRPPMVAHTPTDNRGEPVDMARRRRERARKGLPPDLDRTPPRILPPGVEEAPRPKPPEPLVTKAEPARTEASPPAPALEARPEPAPVRSPPKPASMDDLFGAPQEGRVRLGRAPAADGEKAKRPLVTADGPELRRPPLLRNAAPVPNSVEPPPPTPPKPPEPAAPPALATPPKPAPAPPKPLPDTLTAPPALVEPPKPPKPPPPPPSPSMDDFFGSPAPSSAPPPRRAKATGGLDDLFAAPQEGRVRLGARPKKTVATEGDAPAEPASSTAKEAVDRRPPLLDLPPDRIPKN